jgi:hypothetical protein
VTETPKREKERGGTGEEKKDSASPWDYLNTSKIRKMPRTKNGFRGTHTFV